MADIFENFMLSIAMEAIDITDASEQDANDLTEDPDNPEGTENTSDISTKIPGSGEDDETEDESGDPNEDDTSQDDEGADDDQSGSSDDEDEEFGGDNTEDQSIGQSPEDTVKCKKIHKNTLFLLNILKAHRDSFDQHYGHNTDTELIENFRTITKSFDDLIEVVSDMLTNDFTQGTYIDLTKKYVTVNRVHDIIIRMTEKYVEAYTKIHGNDNSIKK